MSQITQPRTDFLHFKIVCKFTFNADFSVLIVLYYFTAVSCVGESSFSLAGSSDIDCVGSSLTSCGGGRISLLESGASLTVPEGAIPKGTKEQVYVTVLRDDRHRPKLSGTFQ